MVATGTQVHGRVVTLTYQSTSFTSIAKNRLRCQVHYIQAIIQLSIPPAFTKNRIELAFALGVDLETRVSVDREKFAGRGTIS